MTFSSTKFGSFGHYFSMTAKKSLTANFALTKLRNLRVITSIEVMPFLPIITILLDKMFGNDVELYLLAQMFPKK